MLDRVPNTALDCWVLLCPNSRHVLHISSTNSSVTEFYIVQTRTLSLVIKNVMTTYRYLSFYLSPCNKDVSIVLNSFSTIVSLTDKPGSWFLLAKCLKNTCERVTFSWTPGTEGLTLMNSRYSKIIQEAVLLLFLIL